MTDLPASLALQLERVECLSSAHVRVAGMHVTLADEEALAQEQLASALYTRLYSGVHDVHDSGASMVDTLSQANRGTPWWSPGWTVSGPAAFSAATMPPRGEPMVYVHRGPVTLVVPAGACHPNAAIGTAVSILRPTASVRDGDPFYFALGETIGHGRDASLRLYFNVDADGVGPLFEGLTGALNRFQVPFQLKAPTRRGAYRRIDTAVLYIDPRRYSLVARLLMPMLAPIERHLADAVPMCTKRLRPGIGLAEDPGDGSSFGQRRCQQIAAALVECARAGSTAPHECRATVAQHFRAAGLDPKRPYLGPGSHDCFEEWGPGLRLQGSAAGQGLRPDTALIAGP